MKWINGSVSGTHVRGFKRFLGVILAAALAAASLAAQSTYGSLRGTVADSNGGVIPGVKVSLVDEATNLSRSTLTNETGEFTFASVTPSGYRLVAEAPGFKKFERAGVSVATQQAVTVDMKMELGAVTESVMVTEEVPLLETASASQGQVVDRQKLTDLPNLGRNPFMMSRLSPTVQQVGNPAYNRMQDQSGSSQISINGGPVRGNNYLIDGVPITDFSNRAIIIPSLEAVSEMKVQYSTYDAEMGRTGGGMFNTLLKSGSNGYHGSLMGYMRQTDWLANTFFNNRNGKAITDQPFRNYGGSFGGPLSIPKLYNGKDRTFFWLGFEGYRDTQAASREQYTPTALERVGDFSQSLNNSGARLTIYDPLSTQADGSRSPFAGNVIPGARIDKVGRNIAATYMAPNKTTSRYYGDPNLAGAGPRASKADQLFGKFDPQLTSWWRASLSYLRYNSNEPGENPYPTVSSPDQWFLRRYVDATAVNSTLTPSSTWVLTFRYGFNRFPNIGTQASQGFNVASLGFNQAFVKDIASPTFPNVAMQSAYSLGTNNNFNYVHHSKNLSANAAKFMGRHSIKFGYDFRRLHDDGLDFQNSAGAFTFDNRFSRSNSNSSTSASGADIADMLLGAPAGATGFLPTKLYQYVDYNALYIHDDFRFSQKLTFNLGLRWERETGLAEVNNNLITGFDAKAANPIGAAAGVSTPGVFRFAGVNGQPATTGNPNLSKFSPRLGVAYQLTSKIVIRGGWGMFWAPNFPLGSPYNSEGITATTAPSVSNDGNKTPALALSNPFPNGLDKPVGNSLGDLTGVGKPMTIFDPTARSPRVQQFSLDIQRQMGAGWVATLGYSGSRTANLTWTTAALNYNQLNPQFFTLGSALTAAVANPFFGKGGTGVIGGATVARNQLMRPYPQFSSVNFTNSDRNMAQYDSMSVKAEKRMSAGLSVLSAFTWSRNFDMAGGGPGNNLNSGNSGPQDVYGLAGEWGLSYLDSPLRWTNAITYELPFGKGKALMTGANRVVDLLVGGWSANAVSTMQTGYPLQIYMNNNGNSSLGTSRQRPNATGSSPSVAADFGARIDGWINKAAFSDAAPFTLGSVTRTIAMRGPGQVNWDLSVFKSAQVFEGLKVQFRAEALNAMNTPLFRGPNTAFGNAAFGKITSQANFPRMLQLGLRLYF
ncbi:MAG: TonB-dependent receptor [Acidobacteria bacterium]|nr:TonB-dependent receptor [Acidobacteriota bacterium]